MKIEDFKVVNDEKYIESCNSIIFYGNCRNVEFCIKCPFHWHNSTKAFADCTEYSDTNDCVLQDSKLVQSAKEFLELVEFQKRVEYIIMDDEYEIIHRTKTLKEAEDEIATRLIDGANKELSIAKIIRKAKLEKKVVWSE